MDIELLYKFRLSLSYTLRRNLYFCSKSKDKLHRSIKNRQAYFVLPRTGLLMQAIITDKF